jgi:DNA invertase Pin-like site-specific DNA recombinase
MPQVSPVPRRLGYGRVSTDHQSEDQQRAQLEAAGCSEVITETISGARDDRPGLARALAMLQPGDALVVTKLDRLARSLATLLSTAADLEARGINLLVLDQSIDTATPAGRLMFHMLGAIAEFERSLAKERTIASIEHRRANGGDLGGRRLSYNRQQQELGKRLQEEGKSISEISRAIGVSRSATARMLKAA